MIKIKDVKCLLIFLVFKFVENQGVESVKNLIKLTDFV